MKHPFPRPFIFISAFSAGGLTALLASMFVNGFWLTWAFIGLLLVGAWGMAVENIRSRKPDDDRP